MQAALLLIVGLLAMASCRPLAPEPVARAVHLDLNAAQKVAIGRKIWQNECGGRFEGLTAWNHGEEFPSLGIGHFIWYPRGFNGRFQQSWPEFVAYAQQHRANLPAVALEPHCPWNNQAEFQRAFRSAKMQELRRWLVTHVQLQTDFIIDRSLAALPAILAAAPTGERARIAANYERVASTPHGVYALIDYVNFKGDGTVASERYRGQGWGLLQVLDDMRPRPAGQAAASEFSASAIRMLERRVANAPPDRGERRWMQGWRNRCLTYAQPL